MPTAAPTTIAGSATWSSGLVYSDGLRYISVGATLSQAGSLLVTRYLDTAGNIPRAAITASLVASTAAVLDVSDLLPCSTYAVSIVNGSGSTATLSNFIVLMSSG